MNANAKSSKEPSSETTTLAFRHSRSRRKQLELIAVEQGHVNRFGEPVLTPLLQVAIDEYVDRYLRGVAA